MVGAELWGWDEAWGRGACRWWAVSMRGGGVQPGCAQHAGCSASLTHRQRVNRQRA